MHHRREDDEAVVQVRREIKWRHALKWNAVSPRPHEVATGLISRLFGDTLTQLSEVFLRLLRNLV